MANILGSSTTYHGIELPFLKGCIVRIVAVLKGAARPNTDADGLDCDYINDEEDLLRAGGVTTNDRIEVQPWIKEEGRFSFVTSAPRAVDLACFRKIKVPSSPRGFRRCCAG